MMATFLSQEYPTAIYRRQFKFGYGNALVEPLIEWANRGDDPEEIELAAESLDDGLTQISLATHNPSED